MHSPGLSTIQRINLYLGIVPATCVTQGNRPPGQTDKDAAPGFSPFSATLSIGPLLEWVSLINFLLQGSRYFSLIQVTGLNKGINR